MCAALAGHGLACVRGGIDSGRIIFKNINFSLRSGDAMLLQGPNGSGKTTLLRMVSGLMLPKAGRVLWYGDDVSSSFRGRAAQRLRVHYVPAGVRDGNCSYLTVLENATFWSAMLHATADTSRVLSALEQLGLEAYLQTPADHLSLGLRRRLSLCRLICVPRPVWLLDEPTGGLDTASIELCESLVRRHRNQGGIAMIASHSNFRLEEAVSLEFDGKREYAVEFTI